MLQGGVESIKVLWRDASSWRWNFSAGQCPTRLMDCCAGRCQVLEPPLPCKILRDSASKKVPGALLSVACCICKEVTCYMNREGERPCWSGRRAWMVSPGMELCEPWQVLYSVCDAVWSVDWHTRSISCSVWWTRKPLPNSPSGWKWMIQSRFTFSVLLVDPHWHMKVNTTSETISHLHYFD